MTLETYLDDNLHDFGWQRDNCDGPHQGIHPYFGSFC